MELVNRDLYIDNLSGIEFEEYLVRLFENLGYDVQETPASNDYGADLVITKNSEKTVVQAKRYSSTVGISSVQEVIAAKNYYNANKCLVITNNYFTSNAVNLARANDVELWDRDTLVEQAIVSINPSFDSVSVHVDSEVRSEVFCLVGQKNIAKLSEMKFLNLLYFDFGKFKEIFPNVLLRIALFPSVFYYLFLKLFLFVILNGVGIVIKRFITQGTTFTPKD
ncbi:MAG: restriction endonuclease [Bacillota bacterium]|nr:restriction endonuclease [Bacillota bacterium]